MGRSRQPVVDFDHDVTPGTDRKIDEDYDEGLVDGQEQEQDEDEGPDEDEDGDIDEDGDEEGTPLLPIFSAAHLGNLWS